MISRINYAVISGLLKTFFAIKSIIGLVSLIHSFIFTTSYIYLKVTTYDSLLVIISSPIYTQKMTKNIFYTEFSIFPLYITLYLLYQKQPLRKRLLLNL